MARYYEEKQNLVQKELGVKNSHAVPRFEKVIVSVGVGKNRDNKQYLEAVQSDLTRIAGQRPHETRAKKAISGFGVRQGNIVAYRVTLRGQRMRDFIDRFINVTLPRVRDFRGVPVTTIDDQGNVSVGLTEQLAFPEIHADKTDVLFGVGVTLVTTTEDKEQTEALLRVFGFPFQKEEE